MIRRVWIDRFEPADLPSKFEAGTPPIVPAIALANAFEYLTEIGMDCVAAHEAALTKRAHDVLENVEGIRLLGPHPDRKAGIVSFVADGVHAADIAQVIDRHGIAVRAGHHCAQPLHDRFGITASTRASFYIYNTPEEVDRFGEALQATLRLFGARH